MKTETSPFASEGFETFPSLYADNKQVQAYSELATEILERKANEYAAFLEKDDLMPRARQTATRILDHITFELAYREGMYE